MAAPRTTARLPTMCLSTQVVVADLLMLHHPKKLQRSWGTLSHEITAFFFMLPCQHMTLHATARRTHFADHHPLSPVAQSLPSCNLEVIRTKRSIRIFHQDTQYPLAILKHPSLPSSEARLILVEFF